MPIDKKIDHVLFDFDGTIADTLSLGLTLYNESAKQFGFHPVEDGELSELMGMELPALLKLKNIPLYKVPLALFTIRKNMKKRLNEISLFVGIKEFLNDLKNRGYHLSVISSNSKENLELFFKMHDIDVFSYIYSSTTLFGKDKLIKHYLRAVEATSDRVIYVGDEVRDIQAARNSKIKVISVTWGYNSKNIITEFNPDYIVDSIQELNELFV